MNSARRRLARTICTIALLAPLGACMSTEVKQTKGAALATPCKNGQIVDVGAPNPLDRWALFEVQRGPVWVRVKSWQPGLLDPSPYSAVVKVGPSSRPPKPDQNGNIASETARATVVDGKWSKLDVGQGNYWLLASGIAHKVELQACGRALIGAVTPAR